MKTLIIVRHGRYSQADWNLTQQGISETLSMTEKLKLLIPDGSMCVILSSGSARAVQTATLIQGVVGGEHSEHDVLYSDSLTIDPVTPPLQLIAGKETTADVVILVTHYEVTHDLSLHYMRTLKVVCAVPLPLKNSHALVIDLAAPHMTYVTP